MRVLVQVPEEQRHVLGPVSAVQQELRALARLTELQELRVTQVTHQRSGR